MATTLLPRAASRGGSFLVESCTPQDVFSPAELTDDQKLIGRTAEEFIRNEVVPVISDLEQHKPGLLPQLLKKAGEIGLLGGGVPDEYGGAGLDKVSSVQLAEKLSAYASFGVSHGGHSGIGTLPIVFFGTEEQKKNTCRSLQPAKNFRPTACPNRKRDRTLKIRVRAPCFLPTVAPGF